MALRRASTGTTKLDLGDGDFLEVAEEISKKEWNRLVAAMPASVAEDGLTPAQGTQFQTAIFEIFVRGWSSDAPVSVEEYLALDTESAQAVDNALMEHFNNITVKPEETKRRRNSRG